MTHGFITSRYGADVVLLERGGQQRIGKVLITQCSQKIAGWLPCLLMRCANLTRPGRAHREPQRHALPPPVGQPLTSRRPTLYSSGGLVFFNVKMLFNPDELMQDNLTSLRE